MFNIVLNMSYFQYVNIPQKGLLKRPQSQITYMRIYTHIYIYIAAAPLLWDLLATPHKRGVGGTRAIAHSIDCKCSAIYSITWCNPAKSPPSLSRICPCLNCWCFKSRNPRRRRKMATYTTTIMPKFASIMAPLPHHSLKRFARALSCHILLTWYLLVFFSHQVGLFLTIAQSWHSM